MAPGFGRAYLAWPDRPGIMTGPSSGPPGPSRQFGVTAGTAPPTGRAGAACLEGQHIKRPSDTIDARLRVGARPGRPGPRRVAVEGRRAAAGHWQAANGNLGLSLPVAPGPRRTWCQNRRRDCARPRLGAKTAPPSPRPVALSNSGERPRRMRVREGDHDCESTRSFKSAAASSESKCPARSPPVKAWTWALARRSPCRPCCSVSRRARHLSRCTCARVYVVAYACTHAEHAPASTQPHARMHSCMLARTIVKARMHIHTRTHLCARTHAHARVCTHRSCSVSFETRLSK
jgi:hypothetical protein